MAWTYKGRACPDSFGRYVVKSARFDRLLASTALGAGAGSVQPCRHGAAKRLAASMAAVPVPGHHPSPAADGEGLSAKPAQRPPGCARERPKQDGHRLPPPSRRKQPRRRSPTADGGVADKLRELIIEQAVRPPRQPKGRSRRRRGLLQRAQLRAALGEQQRRESSAPNPRSPISPRPTPSVSIRAIIRRRISSRPRMLTRSPRPSSSSPPRR